MLFCLVYCVVACLLCLCEMCTHVLLVLVCLRWAWLVFTVCIVLGLLFPPCVHCLFVWFKCVLLLFVRLVLLTLSVVLFACLFDVFCL